MYYKQNTTIFKGLNSELAPNLIEEGEARDILNFRMNEVGKMINRNGYYIGLESPSGYPYHISGMSDSIIFNRLPQPGGSNIPPNLPSSAYIDVTSHINSQGIVGIGEYIFSEYWDALDTDRVMVYFVRAGNANLLSDNYSHKGTYLFSPLTGELKNKLLVCTSLDYGVSGFDFNSSGRKDFRCVPVTDKKDVDIHGLDFKGHYTVSGNQLFAPNRGLETTFYLSGNCYYPNGEVLSGVREADWIEHFIDMNEYQYKLVISDRINGDLILEDEYDREQYDGSYGEVHELRLRDAALYPFDIDSVEIDLRFASGAENDMYSGVKTPMALYNYEFDKKTTKMTKDHFSKTIGDTEWLGYTAFTSMEGDVADRVEEFLDAGQNSTFITGYTNYKRMAPPEEDPVIGKIDIKYYINSGLDYRFTNSDTITEYDDLFSIPKLKTSELDDKTYADYYLWKDYETEYYPTIGNKDEYTLPNGYTADYIHYLLTEASREFEKIDGGKLKIKELKKHGRFGEDVPLGVWRYRFVWDMGGGLFSAPSAEMLVPDIMWSATKDSDMIYNSEYTRPYYLGGLNSGNPYFYGQYTEQISGYSGLASGAYYLPTPKIFETYNSGLTNFGQKLYDLKQFVYSGQSHRFAPTSGTSWWNHNQQGEFTTLVTLQSNDLVKYNGIFFEGCTIADNETLSADFREDSKMWNRGQVAGNIPGIRTTVQNIILPVFQTPSKSTTFNSLCDDEGRIRTAYLSLDNYAKQYSLSTDGLNIGMGYMEYSDLGNPENDPEQLVSMRYQDVYWGDQYGITDRNFYLNVHCESNDGTRFDDWNNKSTQSEADWNYYRPNTIARVVQEEYDNLFNVNLTIKNDARQRIIKEGIVDITINPVDLPLQSKYIYVTGHPDAGDIAQFSGDAFDYDIVQDNQNKYLYDTHIYWVWNGVLNIYEYTHTNNKTLGNNIEFDTYFGATRFMGVEQLTATVPSSILFEAPRLGLKIPDALVPPRAKKLLVFRTLSSHSNDYLPTMYGLVDEVPVKRISGNAITEYDKDQGLYSGVYYFDKIKDSELDFSVDIDLYDGMTKPLKSRFNNALNERVYKANFIETTAVKDIRKYESGFDASEWGDYMFPDTHVETFACENWTESGYSGNHKMQYRYLYRNMNDVLSEYKETKVIETSGTNQTGIDKYGVVLYMLPAKYDDGIKEVEVYRTTPALAASYTGGDFYYIGKVTPEDEGIFVDTGLKGKQIMPVIQDEVHTYESAFRWSEPFLPDKFKEINFQLVREGDGDQITGLESLYGNMVIFKENSIHRMAVQGRTEPVSRTDEITPNIGCIAPNTLINVDNKLYFLSWEGLYMFDNNSLQKLDGKFNDELQFRMKVAGEKAIRDASCAYNMSTSELYLNIPIGINKDTNGNIVYSDINKRYGYNKEYLGHIYVINMLHGYATKYAYTNTAEIPSDKFGNFPMAKYLTEAKDSSEVLRMYYNNTLGELRSADIVPRRYNMHYSGIDAVDEANYTHAGFYIETPYEQSGLELFKGTDSIIHNTSDYGGSGMYERYLISGFPNKVEYPIKNIYRSKFYDMNNGTVNKRIRENNFDIYSDGFIDITTSTTNNYNGQTFDRIDKTDYKTRTESFNPTIDYASGAYYKGYSGSEVFAISGTDDNYIHIVNNTVRTLDITDMDGNTDNDVYTVDDRLAKGKQYQIEIATEGYTYVSEYNFYWRMIHSHLR